MRYLMSVVLLMISINAFAWECNGCAELKNTYEVQQQYDRMNKL
jgi:hypothetical protein